MGLYPRDTYRPRLGRQRVHMQYLSSAVIGTGGTTVADSATTTVSISSPSVEGFVDSLSMRADVAAVSASGTVLLTVYKWDVAAGAAVALNTAVSLEAAGLTALKTVLPITVLATLTPAQRTKLAEDTFYAEIVTNNSVGTQPTRCQVTVGLAQRK